MRPRELLTLGLLHGDMAAKGIAEVFMLGVAVAFFAVTVVLGVAAWRMTAKVDSPGAVFRAGLVGVLAVTAFALAGGSAAMGFSQTPPAFGALLAAVPALFAAQLFVSARLYRRVEARGLSVVSAVLGVVFALVAALAAFALVVDAVAPRSERTSGEVRAYRDGCEHDDAGACNMLGLRLRTGTGVARDATAATRAFEKACTLRASTGCRNLAEMLGTGEGVPRDEAAAHRWMEKFTALEHPPVADSGTSGAPAFVVRYACDDKYAEEAQCSPGRPAWNEWLAGLQLESANLLDHHGGGPGGAEWNPQAALVAFVASTEAGRTQLKLASGRALSPTSRFGAYDVFVVPSSVWETAARAGRRGDLADDAPVEAISVVELQASGPSGELGHGTFAFSGGE